ncbi:MAG TPA: hypothetical protein VJP79_04300 [Nitrososphaera sp.]|nr:hypothetical protein [Nitrososphaera sp.]
MKRNSSASTKRPESRTASFRVDGRLLNSLMQEAELKQISLNTLANQIFKEYVEWYSSAPKAGYVTVRKSLIVRMLGDLTEEQILDYAKSTATDSRDINLLLTGEYTIESVLRVIEHKVRISGYRYRRELKGDSQNYIIQHDLGRKWSLYLGELFRAEFEEVGHRDTEFEILENILVFRIKLKGDRSS